mmetsp:Transcript_14550/g.57146  ORF Transcript_14550/g.57146 Transcript_14550/m.57146 type:complete len:372 (-) Transcript_14550:109-1224(-)
MSGTAQAKRSPNKRDRTQFEGTKCAPAAAVPVKKKKRDALTSSQDELRPPTTWVHHRPPQAKKHSFLFRSEKGRPDDKKKGFLVSCNRPSQAISGLFWLLNKVAEDCYSAELEEWRKEVASIVERNADPPSSLQRILGKNLKLFQTVNSGCKGVLIVVVRSAGVARPRQPPAALGPTGSPLAQPQPQVTPPNVSPSEVAAWASFDELVLSRVSPTRVAKALLEDMLRVHCSDDGGLKAEYGQNTAFLGRILPMDVIVEAKPELILEAAKPLIEKAFPAGPGQPCIRYATQVSVRNNPLKKSTVINGIGKLVGPHHIVDLANPELCVIVEVTKAACGISVVRDYFPYRKFNMKMVLDKGTAKPPAAAAGVAT